MSTAAGVPKPILAPGETDRKANVYVLADHRNGRPFIPAPARNAAEQDLAAIYNIDRLAVYPAVRDRFEFRRLQEGVRRRANRDWAQMALDALYQGKPVPGTKHLQRERVLDMLRIAGPEGATRKEICRAYGVDGGKISAALTMLHECGAIYPLTGVRR